MTEPIEIWHNTRCSKSRETLALLRARGIDPRVRLYLEDAPSREALARAAALLGGARALLRTGEEGAPGADASDDAILDVLATTPRLIQRPVVLVADRAAIGRPPEAVLALLEG